jgi:hypothetical protein
MKEPGAIENTTQGGSVAVVKNRAHVGMENKRDVGQNFH